jgi:hypothetical protein
MNHIVHRDWPQIHRHFLGPMNRLVQFHESSTFLNRSAIPFTNEPKRLNSVLFTPLSPRLNLNVHATCSSFTLKQMFSTRCIDVYHPANVARHWYFLIRLYHSTNYLSQQLFLFVIASMGLSGIFQDNMPHFEEACRCSHNISSVVLPQHLPLERERASTLMPKVNDLQGRTHSIPNRHGRARVRVHLAAEQQRQSANQISLPNNPTDGM